MSALEGTLIGQQLRKSPTRLAVVAAIGVIVCCADFLFLWRSASAIETYQGAAAAYEKMTKEGSSNSEMRSAHTSRSYHRLAAIEDCADVVRVRMLMLVALATYSLLVEGHLPSIGLSWASNRGWRYWCAVGPLLAVAVGVLSVCLWVVCSLLGWRMDAVLAWDINASVVFIDGLLLAPVLEELIYRLGICTPAAAFLSRRKVIILSGTVFAMSHVIGGVANPMNLLGGYFLAWAFLESNTILVPILFHAGGNALAWCLLIEWRPLLRF